MKQCSVVDVLTAALVKTAQAECPVQVKCEQKHMAEFTAILNYSCFSITLGSSKT